MLSRVSRLLARLAVALSLVGSPAPAAAFEPAQDEELAYSIGLQAYVWAYPMMDLYRTLWETSLDPARGHDKTLNELYQFTRLVTHEDDWVVTPNEDTIYDFGFLDLRDGPVILSIPEMGDRKYWFPVGDMRHDFDTHLSWDTVGSRGGAFAFCPPGWQGVVPQGVSRVDVSTPIVWLGGRYAVNGPDDLPAVTALQAKVRLVPLSQWGQAQVPRPVIDAAAWPVFPRDDLTNARAYFTTMNEVLRLTSRLGSDDAAMAGFLHELTLAPDQRFDWDALSPAAQKGLERAAAEGHRIIDARTARAVPMVNGWQLARFPAQSSDAPLVAAASAMIGLLYNPAEVSTYDLAFTDGTGAALTGANRYVLHYDVPPPVNAFWSLSMYDAKTRSFVESAINRYSIGDGTPGLVYGADGSVDIYLQRDEPADPTERANWLPTPEGPFYVVGRAYSPRAAILNGDWVPQAIVRR